MTYTIEIDEEQRQLLLLALAQLSLERPGWHYVTGEAAARFPEGREMFEEFRRINADEEPHRCPVMLPNQHGTERCGRNRGHAGKCCYQRGD